MRSDARDNRELILAEARRAFAERGPEVAMREIAERAGVAPATLYRRFPTKEALVREAFAREMAVCEAVVDEGLAADDAWAGFRLVVEKVFALQATERGFHELFAAAYPGAFDSAALRERAALRVGELIRRARESGRLRPDFVLDDLLLAMRANTGVAAAPGMSPAAARAASRRFTALMLDSFAAQSALPPAVRLPFPGALRRPATRRAPTVP